MIPSHFIQLEAMPLTANGKVDKRKLPVPAAEETHAAYKAPENETEEILAAIWEEVLGIKRPGIDDNFFSVGGHSLKAMMLTAKIQEQLQKTFRSKYCLKSRRSGACRISPRGVKRGRSR